MAIEAGAATEGLGGMLLHPHYYNGPVRVDAIAQEPCTMWVNKKGERFTDETITFRATECGNAINRQLDKCAYVLLDKSIKKRIEREGFLRGGMHGVDEITGTEMSHLHEVLVKETEKGDIKISDSWNDIAEWMDVLPEVLNKTVREYNRFCDKGYDEVFNKERRYLQALLEPPYYAIKCFVSCLDTIGGIKINQHMEVLNNQDNPIRGLYAGGDTVGGWESDTYCILLPGSAFGFAINSGRIAGENAFKYVSGKKIANHSILK
jgi:fumarate reductase flavoprotein subunit